MKRNIAWILAAVMVVSALAGCNTTTPVSSGTSSSVSSSAEDFSETETLNLVWPADTGTELLPCPWDFSSIAASMMFDTLVVLDPDGETIVKRMAEDYSVSDDGLTYTFTIRDGMKWHDGQAVTVDDVVWSLNGYIKYPGSPYSSIISYIKGGDKVKAGEADECSGISTSGNKITITLSSPRGDFLINLAVVSILPKHLLEDADITLLGKDADFWAKPVGCGPYAVKEVNIPNYFTVERFADYYGTPAGIKTVCFTSYVNGGSDAVTADLISGKLDFANGQSINDINFANNIVASNSDVTMTIVPATYARYFVFNTTGSTDGKYNDEVMKTEVRQAFNLLLDKEAIADFYSGQAVALTTYVNPESPYYNTEIPLFKRDVETAKEMLKDADFDFNSTIRMLYYYKDQTTADIMALIKQNFSDAGVKLETFLITGDLLSIEYDQRNWDMSYFGNYGLEPVDTFYYNVTTVNPMINKIGGNFDDIKTTVFDPLYEDYFATIDPAEKQEILNQFQVEGLKYMFTIPLYAMNKLVLTNSKRFTYDSKIFNLDIADWVDYRFSTWKLIKE